MRSKANELYPLCLEDSDVTESVLREEGCPEWVLEALAYLTRETGESYDQYLPHVKGNSIARSDKALLPGDNGSYEWAEGFAGSTIVRTVGRGARLFGRAYTVFVWRSLGSAKSKVQSRKVRAQGSGLDVRPFSPSAMGRMGIVGTMGPTPGFDLRRSSTFPLDPCSLTPGCAILA